jgi:hypothetical protein
MIKLESGARRKAVRASECLPSRTNTGARRNSVAKLVLISLPVTTNLLIHDQLHRYTHAQETSNVMHELDHNYQVACVCVYICTQNALWATIAQADASRLWEYSLGMPWSLGCLSSNGKDVLRCFNQVRCKIRAGQVGPSKCWFHLIYTQTHATCIHAVWCTIMPKLDHIIKWSSCMCMCVYMNTERLVGRDGPSRRVEAVRIQPCHCLGMPWSLDCLAMKEMCFVVSIKFVVKSELAKRRPKLVMIDLHWINNDRVHVIRLINWNKCASFHINTVLPSTIVLVCLGVSKTVPQLEFGAVFRLHGHTAIDD